MVHQSVVLGCKIIKASYIRNENHSKLHNLYTLIIAISVLRQYTAEKEYGI
jgi:hypothetical protein